METNKINIQTPVPRPKRRLNLFGKLLVTFVILVFVGAIASSVYFYKKSKVEVKDDAKTNLEETIEKIGRHYLLPEGETPTLATVLNPEELKNQQFFLRAKKGDIVLIYAEAKKAILYDPVADKIIEVAPVKPATDLSTTTGSFN